MDITIRRGTPADAEACGRIIHEAFTALGDRHGFPSTFPVPEAGIRHATMLLSNPGFYCLVAERDGHLVASNFLDERSPVAGLGPITVSPKEQDDGIGRELMRRMLARASERRYPGVRLLQAAYHPRSLALYSKLGFDVRELCSTMQGPRIRVAIPGCSVRGAVEGDLEACDGLCIRVHGHERSGELLDAIRDGSASVVERGGRITGYTTYIAFWGYAVGETNEDLKALIVAAPEYGGPGFFVPASNTELMRWCLQNGLRIVHNYTLMTLGLYNEPQGAYLPSILM